MNTEKVHAARADAAVTQSRGESVPDDGSPDGDPRQNCPELGTDFDFGPGVERSSQVHPHERLPREPLYRPLRIFTLDPAESKLDGAVGEVKVPYEPLGAGPAGSLLRVDTTDVDTGEKHPEADLESSVVLLRDGYDPSPADLRFHGQMVYAVCSMTYDAFRHALGRVVAWGFGAHPEDKNGTRLVLQPFGGDGHNAAYDPRNGALRFEVFAANQDVTGRNVPFGTIFTCLSHDVVAHEMTHALIDGLRSEFLSARNADTPGFHEGFADLVAIFQRFSYPNVVAAAIRASAEKLEHSHLLTQVALQLGQTTRPGGEPARTAIDLNPDGTIKPRLYSPCLDVHDMGGVLMSAVFTAFLTVYKRKTERYIRVATGGKRIFTGGEVLEDLQAVLADEASQLASQFLNICIRAIDYCPPVDLKLGEFLRAVITADLDLVPDDPWGYREAWIESFARHKIYPPDVKGLSEEELRWPMPKEQEHVPMLRFGMRRFNGDPANAASQKEIRRQACELGRYAVAHRQGCGLATTEDDPALLGETVGRPVVGSVRSARRVGPDGQVVFDLVGEVIQERTVKLPAGGGTMSMFGGATVILGPAGDIRYVIAKAVTDNKRRQEQIDFVTGDCGKRFWERDASGAVIPKANFFEALHAAAEAPPVAGATGTPPVADGAPPPADGTPPPSSPGA